MSRHAESIAADARIRAARLPASASARSTTGTLTPALRLEDDARGRRAGVLALPLRHLERAVDFGQREAVRDDLGQRVLVLRAHEKVERAGHDPRDVVHETLPQGLLRAGLVGGLRGWL